MAKRLNTLVVTRTERLSPHFVRLYLGGGGFDDFTGGGRRRAQDTDMYVKLIFGVPGVSYPEPFDPRQSANPSAAAASGVTHLHDPHDRSGGARTGHRLRRPRRRRHCRSVGRRVQPGEVVRFLGPGSGYRPRADAPWHLLACDESGCPRWRPRWRPYPTTRRRRCSSRSPPKPTNPT